MEIQLGWLDPQGDEWFSKALLNPSGEIAQVYCDASLSNWFHFCYARPPLLKARETRQNGQDQLPIWMNKQSLAVICTVRQVHSRWACFPFQE
jgi:hypothetical protein